MHARSKRSGAYAHPFQRTQRAVAPVKACLGVCTPVSASTAGGRDLPSATAHIIARALFRAPSPPPNRSRISTHVNRRCSIACLKACASRLERHGAFPRRSMARSVHNDVLDTEEQPVERGDAENEAAGRC